MTATKLIEFYLSNRQCLEPDLKENVEEFL